MCNQQVDVSCGNVPEAPSEAQTSPDCEQLVRSGRERDWVKLPVGGHCELRRREIQNKGGFHLSSQLEVIIRFEPDPVALWHRPLGLGKPQLPAFRAEPGRRAGSGGWRGT